MHRQDGQVWVEYWQDSHILHLQELRLSPCSTLRPRVDAREVGKALPRCDAGRALRVVRAVLRVKFTQAPLPLLHPRWSQREEQGSQEQHEAWQLGEEELRHPGSDFLLE